ncbi:MAG TPA: hypothetical protein VM925_04080 [Labilithrix sp.]|nr:hypothetical protein [Labilithrix sp.]
MSLASFALPLFLVPALETAPAPAPTETPAANVIFAEVLGSGLLYSLNYERFVDRWNLGLRAGASFFTYDVSSYGSTGNLTIVTFPLLASYYLGWRSHKLQLGLGATILHTKVATDSQGTAFEGERSGTGLAPSAVVGYRYVPRDGGISFGIGFTPLLRATKFLPWGGATVGYVF